MSYTIQFEAQKKGPVTIQGKDIPQGTTFAFGKNGETSIMHKGHYGKYIWLSALGKPERCAFSGAFEVSVMYTDDSSFTNYRPVELHLSVKEL